MIPLLGSNSKILRAISECKCSRGPAQETWNGEVEIDTDAGRAYCHIGDICTIGNLLR